DGLGQELAAAKMILDGILMKDTSPSMRQASADASQLVDRTIQQVRSFSHLLHPPLLDEVGLVSALRWFLEGFTKRSGLHTVLEVEPQEFPRLPSELETAIFRIVQEALNNVFRHAKARNCWITVKHASGQVTVTVRDDGKGVEQGVTEFRPDRIGMGIGGIRQRIKEFGGELRLARLNPGTLVEVVIPTKSLPQAPQTSKV